MLQVLKWNFTASRSEYVDQLKEQMQPCFSRSLIHNMYQDDFKFHVQAITVLTNVSCLFVLCLYFLSFIGEGKHCN